MLCANFPAGWITGRLGSATQAPHIFPWKLVPYRIFELSFFLPLASILIASCSPWSDPEWVEFLMAYPAYTSIEGDRPVMNEGYSSSIGSQPLLHSWTIVELTASLVRSQRCRSAPLRTSRMNRQWGYTSTNWELPLAPAVWQGAVCQAQFFQHWVPQRHHYPCRPEGSLRLPGSSPVRMPSRKKLTHPPGLRMTLYLMRTAHWLVLRALSLLHSSPHALVG